MILSPKYRGARVSCAVVFLLAALLQTSSAFSSRLPRNVLNSVATGSSPLSSNPRIAAIAPMASAHAMPIKKTEDERQPRSIRRRLRQLTGFSLTAFRATMRAVTGVSLTALYASAFAATSAFVRRTMTLILAPFPPWFRYFLQPFLVLYYAPLFILRNLTGPTGKRAKETHQSFVEGFRSAVDAAEKKADGYWPVHVNEDGDIVHVQRSANEKDYDVNDGVAESMEVLMEDVTNSEKE